MAKLYQGVRFETIEAPIAGSSLHPQCCEI